MIKKQSIVRRTRIKVTTYLYLSLNNRARSLSTLMAVDVKMDNPHKSALEAMRTASRYLP